MLPKKKSKFKKINDLDLERFHKVFGYSKEDIEKVIYPMTKNASEPIGSMGNGPSGMRMVSQWSKGLS